MIIQTQKGQTKIEHHVCDFHRKHPRTDFAGCTCSGAYIFVTSGCPIDISDFPCDKVLKDVYKFTDYSWEKLLDRF